MQKHDKGRLIVISGPSGTGKGTVISRLMERKDYFFLTREEFSERVEAGGLLEHAEFVGNCYGTPKDFVERKIDEGVSVILEIDVQGAAQVAKACAAAVSVFILPPSGTELERRLRGRHTDSEEKIRSRLLEAKRECAEAAKYGYIVVNDSAEAAAREIDAIITAEKCKSAYRINLVTEVLIS